MMKTNGKTGSTNNLWLQLFICLIFACCWQPSFATSTTPTSDFIDNGDGTVTHKTTGLMWMRCAVGQTWDQINSMCLGYGGSYSEKQVVLLKTTFAGYSDWRLSNIVELRGIANQLSPFVTTLFSKTDYSSSTLSSTVYAGDSTLVWSIGNSSFSNRSTMAYCSHRSRACNSIFRLVRGGQPLRNGLFTPTADFIDNADGTVTHQPTGLIWQRCSVGQIWTGSTCSGTATVYSSFSQLIALTDTFAEHNGWRVPDINELTSLIEYGAYNPAINTQIFPNAAYSSLVFDYQSPILLGYVAPYLISVNFLSGGSEATYTSSVRLVRTPQLTKVLSLLVLDVAKPAMLTVDFAANYDSKYTKEIELINSSTNPITIANVIISDAGSYWVNLFADSKNSCHAQDYTADNKSFIIPAQNACHINIGFSPFNNATAGKSINATLTLKTILNGIDVDKVINLTGIGREQIAFSGDGLWGEWGVIQIKQGKPNESAIDPRFWYSNYYGKAHHGNIEVFAANNQNPEGYLGIVIQDKPVIVLSSTDVKDQNGKITHQWQVKPISWYPIKPIENNGVIWQPLIIGVDRTSTRHYGFINWNSSLY